MIETLSKLSRTPIAIATGIRYVVGLVSGGNNASCMVFLQVAVGGHIGDISTSFAYKAKEVEMSPSLSGSG